MWRLGNPVSFFLFLTKDSCIQYSRQSIITSQKIESFASISQVMWPVVICVLNLKLETPGYGWLIPESTGKEHCR